MNLLQRYFRSQAFWPLILSLSALALLALLTQSLQTLELIVENRQSAWTFFKITFLALPQLIAIIIPLAVFMGSLYALNRLNGDSELIVAKASGFSPWKISAPLIRLGVFAMMVHLIINLSLQPYAFRQMRAEILEVRTDIASQLVQEGEFVTPVAGLTVYARDIDPNGQLKDVVIYDARDSDEPITHLAKSGEIQRGESTVVLRLYNGGVQQLLEDGSLDYIGFEDYIIDLSNVTMDDNILRFKSSDKYLHELLRPDPREPINKKFKQELAAEGHARLAAPLYNIALVFLALCFMVRGEHLRLGYGRRIAICAFTGFMLRLTGFGVASAAETNVALNYVQYAIPLSVILFGVVYLTQRKRKRRWGRKKRARQYDEGVRNFVSEIPVQ